jgi:3-phenylpropionate/trans-cinnamate dioxygenase ferredoxin component
VSGYLRACSVHDVPPESALAVEIAGTELAIVHSDGQFFAVADECSHAAVPLSEGDVGDGEIECYFHGSRFDLRTGQPTGLPATEPVPVYRCHVEGDDVMVDVSAPYLSGGDDPPGPPLQTVPDSLDTSNAQES